MSEEPRRSAYKWMLRRLLDQYKATGLVGGVRPRSAHHALTLAKALAAKTSQVKEVS